MTTLPIVHLTREAWLQAAITELRPIFASHAAPLPDVIRVSLGWPAGARSKRPNASTSTTSTPQTIGEYWPAGLAADSLPSIFISPSIGDPTRALDILIHELCHAAAPRDGHGKAFKRIALKMGLEGKMTATTASQALTVQLVAMQANTLGLFPHGALSLDDSPKKKQGTRMLKATCAATEYTVRLSQKWVDLGLPSCPCCGETMTLEALEESEES